MPSASAAQAAIAATAPEHRREPRSAPLVERDDVLRLRARGGEDPVAELRSRRLPDRGRGHRGGDLGQRA